MERRRRGAGAWAPTRRNGSNEGPAPGRLRGAGACLPPGKLGDVITDVLAALMEAFELGIGEVESVDLLDALGTNYAGERREDALFAGRT